MPTEIKINGENRAIGYSDYVKPIIDEAQQLVEFMNTEKNRDVAYLKINKIAQHLGENIPAEEKIRMRIILAMIEEGLGK